MYPCLEQHTNMSLEGYQKTNVEFKTQMFVPMV